MRVVLTGPRSADVDGRLLLDPAPAQAPAPRPSSRPGQWRDPSAPDVGPEPPGPAPGPIALHTTPGPGRDRPWTGDRRHVAGLVVLAVPAGLPDGGPDPDRVCLLVTDEAGRRLLWAPVPHPLPAATLSALRGLHLDLVFLAGEEESPGPHGLQGLGSLLGEDGGGRLVREVARLRGAGAVDDRTKVHALPPASAPGVLEDRRPGVVAASASPRLPWSATVSGAVSAAAEGLVCRAADPTSAPVPARPRRVLVLGPAAGGKSAWAEAWVSAEPSVTYLATGPAPSPDDTDWSERVDRHRRRRPAWWQTVEAPTTVAVVAALAQATGTVLWDSAGSWLTGVLDRHDAWTGAAGWRAGVDEETEALMVALRDSPARVVVVSEEVGWSVVPETAAGRLFRDLLGALNQRLAWESDSVLLVVAGRALPMPAAVAVPAAGPALPGSPGVTVAQVAAGGTTPGRSGADSGGGVR